MDSAVTASARSSGRPVHQLGGLVWTLVRTDFRTRYHGTMGGFLWALLKPLTMFLVLMGVFSFVFSNTPQYRIGLILGLFLYEFFQEGTRTGLESLRAKGYLLVKAKFPSWIIVVASLSNAAITLALFSLVLITFLVLAGRAPSVIGLMLYVWYLLHYVAIVMGFSLAASALFMRYRDLNQIWEVVTHAGFFMAPIIYPIGILPERVHFYLFLWPPTPIILFARNVLLDGRPPSALAHALLSLEAATVLSVGVAIYRSRAPYVAEYV
jgi:ABC-type polysaccharide/polyol phosphate export permease